MVRVTDGTRIVENIGAASFRFDYQAGDAIKRATTQGYRRAIIQFAGVGAVSEEDIDDIAGAQKLGMAGVTGTRTNPTTGEITASPAPKQLTGRAAEMPDTSRVRYPQQEAAKAEADGAKPATDKMYAVLIDLISQARSLGEPLNYPEAGMTIAQARTLRVLQEEIPQRVLRHQKRLRWADEQRAIRPQWRLAGLGARTRHSVRAAHYLPWPPPAEPSAQCGTKPPWGAWSFYDSVASGALAPSAAASPTAVPHVTWARPSPRARRADVALGLSGTDARAPGQTGAGAA